MTEQPKRYEVIDKKTHVIYKDNMTSMIHSVPKKQEGNMTESHSISSPQFIDEVYEICKAYNPDIVEASSFKEVLDQLQVMKDKAMRWEIIVSSFKPEPELFPVRQTLADARARQAELRQGQL